MSDDLKLHFLVVRNPEKPAALLYLMKEEIPKTHQTIVFAATRYHVEYVHALAEKSGLKATFIYGAMD